MNSRESFPDPAEISHVIGATGTFSLRTVSGSVRVRGADTDTAQVIARAGGDDSLPLVVRRSEGGLHIETDQKSNWILGGSLFRGPRDIDFEITLPRGARLDLHGVSADMEAAGLAGEQTYRSVSGDLRIEAASGRLSVTTVSGDVEMTAEAAVDVRLTTTSGDVELAAPSIASLQLRTVSGDARLRGAFAVGPEHQVDTVSGDLLVETSAGLTVDQKRGLDISKREDRRLVAGDGAARLRFRSLSGDVSLSGEAPSAASGDTGRRETVDSLEVLRALERGEIDVDEAARRLEGVSGG